MHGSIVGNRRSAAEVGVLVDDPVCEDAAMKALGVVETRNGAGL
jgi:hypothetical protein